MDRLTGVKDGPVIDTRGIVSLMTTYNTTDGRWRGRPPQRPPSGMVLVSRERAAQIAGVTPRTITRWADRAYVTKYLDGRGRIRFSHAEVSALRDTDPETDPPEPAPETPPPARW